MAATSTASGGGTASDCHHCHCSLAVPLLAAFAGSGRKKKGRWQKAWVPSLTAQGAVALPVHWPYALRLSLNCLALSDAPGNRIKNGRGCGGGWHDIVFRIHFGLRPRSCGAGKCKRATAQESVARSLSYTWLLDCGRSSLSAASMRITWRSGGPRGGWGAAGSAAAGVSKQAVASKTVRLIRPDHLARAIFFSLCVERSQYMQRRAPERY